MLFNSISFLFFFSVTVILFFSIPFSFRKFLLLGASYFFYMMWEPAYGLLIAFSTVLSYLTAIVIAKKQFLERKKYIWLCFFINIGILFFFKYFNFFNENFRYVFGCLNLNYPIPDLLRIALPVGISFYTFETISYVLDVYYDRRGAENKLSTYALYISFFPKLLAGPIEKSTGLLMQLDKETSVDYDRIICGLRRMLWGFFKKIVIADRLSLLVDPVYANPDGYSGGFVLLTCYLFAFQIYCDFSGYTDVAIGASKIFGYDIVENFDHPYKSKNVGEFWRRWHLSLSNWLRDYLFTPIVFKRKAWKNNALVYATFVTFILCGLWHGAKWTFIIFGLLQAMAISYELLSKNLRKKWRTILPISFYNGVSFLLTFHFIVFCFIFFRAENVANASAIIYRIVNLYSENTLIQEVSKFGVFSLAIVLFSIAFMLFIENKFKPSLEAFNDKKQFDYVFSSITLTLLIILGYYHPQVFIYFNF